MSYGSYRSEETSWALGCTLLLTRQLYERLVPSSSTVSHQAVFPSLNWKRLSVQLVHVTAAMASSQSDAGTMGDSLETPSMQSSRPSDRRARRRVSEQRSRQKRKETIESMPEQVATLERVVVALRLISDPDVLWDEFMDNETKRVRAALRRFLPVLDQAKRLREGKIQLTRLLREHALASEVIARITTKEMDADDWGVRVHHWKKLAKRHFHRLTMEQCVCIMNDALVEMHRFKTCENTESSGLSFMGWRDSRRLINDGNALEFSLNKTFRGYDLNQHMEMTWRIYSEQALYARIVPGSRARAAVDVLQVISPTAWVVCVSEGYFDLPLTVHDLFLLFRVETEKGAIQYLQCLHDEDLENAINDPSDVWTSNCIWMEWEVLDETKDQSSTDFRLTVGGCLHGGGAEFLGRWMCEILAVLVRSEIVANNRLTLQF